MGVDAVVNDRKGSRLNDGMVEGGWLFSAVDECETAGGFKPARSSCQIAPCISFLADVLMVKMQDRSRGTAMAGACPACLVPIVLDGKAGIALWCFPASCGGSREYRPGRHLVEGFLPGFKQRAQANGRRKCSDQKPYLRGMYSPSRIAEIQRQFKRGLAGLCATFQNLALLLFGKSRVEVCGRRTKS